MNLIHGKQINPKLGGIGLTMSNGSLSVLLSDYFTISNGVIQIDSTRFILQGGNTLSTTAYIGTNDNNTLTFKTYNRNNLNLYSNGVLNITNMTSDEDNLLNVNTHGDVIRNQYFKNNVYNNNVYIIKRQVDGKILVGGTFTSVNGITRNRLLRLNANGTEDVDFNYNLGSGFDGRIYDIGILSDGSIIVVGNFTYSNSNYSPNIAKLYSDGNVDYSFSGNISTRNGYVNKLYVLNDDSIILCGTFSVFNGTDRYKLYKLYSDGTEDVSFNDSVGGMFISATIINAISVDINDKIVIGGDFGTLNGNPRNYICRLNSDGTEDTDFYDNLGDAFTDIVHSVHCYKNYILIGGSFTTFNNNTRNQLVRLNLDGTEDNIFVNNYVLSTTDGYINNIKTQIDDKIIITIVDNINEYVYDYVDGYFEINGIQRFNMDGSNDDTFNSKIGSSADDNIYTLELQEDGKILLGGSFNSFDGNTKTHLVRINYNGALDTSKEYIKHNGNNISENIVLGTNDNYDLILKTNNTNRLQLTNDGKYIFNTLTGSISDLLYISATGSIGRTSSVDFIGSGLSSSYIIQGGNTLNTDVVIGTLDNKSFNIVTNGNNSLVISKNGDVSIPKLISSSTDIVIASTTGSLSKTSSATFLKTGLSGSYFINGGNVFGTSAVIGTKNLQELSFKMNDKVLFNIDKTNNYNFYNNTRITFPNIIGSGFDSIVRTIEILDDDSILIGGEFTTYNNFSHTGIIKLNSSGIEDVNFNNNVGNDFSRTINTIKKQTDGKLLLGGSFINFNGHTASNLVRLNSDGTLDTVFNNNLGASFNRYIQCVSIQSDNKILVGGGYRRFNNATCSYITRLNSDGTRDNSFDPRLVGLNFFSSNIINSILLDTDDNIILGGHFTNFDGLIGDRNNIVILNLDGTENTSFYSILGTAFNSDIIDMKLLSNGSIIVVGSFTVFNGNDRKYIVKLYSDGTEDTNFYSNLGTGFVAQYIQNIYIESNDKIILGGSFTRFNGLSRLNLIRLNADGTEDTSFYTNLGNSFNSVVTSINKQSSGKILIGGNFTSYNDNIRNRIARLYNSVLKI